MMATEAKDWIILTKLLNVTELWLGCIILIWGSILEMSPF